MNINYTHLVYFVKTAEKLNFTRAAEDLFITRQSLRQAISSLEKEIGKPLFRNEKNRLSLTEYGVYLYAEGKKVLLSFEKLQTGIARLVQGTSTLRIGYSRSLFPFILPNTEKSLQEFQKEFPDLTLKVEQMDNDDAISAVMDGRLDAGCVLQFPSVRENCTLFPLKEFDVALDYSSQKPFGEKRFVTEEDLSGIPCVGIGGLELTMQPLGEVCERKGIRFPYRIMPSALDAFYHISHGLAVGFDILKTDVPGFDWDKTSVLSGYRWELGFLCSSNCEDPALLRLFCRFMQCEYEKQL